MPDVETVALDDPWADIDEVSDPVSPAEDEEVGMETPIPARRDEMGDVDDQQSIAGEPLDADSDDGYGEPVVTGESVPGDSDHDYSEPAIAGAPASDTDEPHSALGGELLRKVRSFVAGEGDGGTLAEDIRWMIPGSPDEGTVEEMSRSIEILVLHPVPARREEGNRLAGELAIEPAVRELVGALGDELDEGKKAELVQVLGAPRRTERPCFGRGIGGR